MKYFGTAEYVDEQTYINRISQCRNCEHLVTLIPLAGGTCKLCGCFVKAKAKYKASECPASIPKWTSIKLVKP